jgi:hypothetical protein
MSNLLLITSSLFGDQSKSAQIAGEFVESWRRAHPGTAVTQRELTPDSMPHLSLDALGALLIQAEQRTAEQRASVVFDDRLIVGARSRGRDRARGPDVQFFDSFNAEGVDRSCCARRSHLPLHRRRPRRPA